MLLGIVIASNLYVNDFVIVGDTVFFCGRNANGDIGFFGHFLIQDFFLNTHGYTVTDFTFLTSQGQVRSFDKMVTYLESGVRIFAAIGHSTTGNYVVAELNFEPNVPTYQYNIGELTTSSNESILDIALTNSYVITAGFENAYSTDRLLCVRVYERSSLFTNNGPQDVANYIYPASLPSTYFEGNQLVITNLLHDEFAVAAYWTFQNSSTTLGTYVGIYEIGSNYSLTSLGSIRIDQSPNYLNGGWTLRGMTPQGPTSMFYLLQNAEYSPLGPVLFVNEIIKLDYTLITTPPPPSGDYLDMLYREDPYLQSIDALGNINDFMTIGFYNAHPKDPRYLAYYYSSTVNGTPCHLPGTVWFDRVTMPQSRYNNAPFVVYNGAGQTFLPYTGVEMQFQIVSGCNQ